MHELNDPLHSLSPNEIPRHVYLLFRLLRLYLNTFLILLCKHVNKLKDCEDRIYKSEANTGDIKRRFYNKK